MKATELYEKDFYEWTIHNADLLFSGEFAKADVAHIAEEIRDMGIRERRELVSRLRVWRVTKLNQRHEIAALLDEMPSLRDQLEDALPAACRRAVEVAAAETGLPRNRFPTECPFA